MTLYLVDKIVEQLELPASEPIEPEDHIDVAGIECIGKFDAGGDITVYAWSDGKVHIEGTDQVVEAEADGIWELAEVSYQMIQEALATLAACEAVGWRP